MYDSRHPLDLMLLELRPDLREDGTPTPEPADGRYRYFDRKILDRSGQAGDTLRIQEEEEDNDNDDNDYDQEGGGWGRGEKSSLDDVEPDDVGESDKDNEDNEDDKDDKYDEDDEDNEVERVSQIPEKASAARIDHVSSKL